MTFDIKKIPIYKRALSFFHPVWIKNEVGEINPHLELLLYKDRIQLATSDALYSDGDQYTPAIAVVNDLKGFLPRVKKMLILGVGLGSMVQIMRKGGFSPTFTLVEIDKVVLRLAMQYLENDPGAKLEPICEDAQVFVAKTTEKYDLIFIDIFNSRVVPDFVTSREFLAHCRACLAPGGRLSFNYILNNEADWAPLISAFSGVFPHYHVVNSDINRIFIAEV